MSVVTYIEQPDSEELQEFYRLVHGASRGLGVLNVFKVLAHAPELMRAWWGLMTVLLTRLELPARHRELAILRLFQVTGAAYGFAHHVRIAGQVGLGDEHIAALARYDESPLFSAEDRLVLRYTDAVVRLDEAAPRIAAEVKASMGERRLVELTVCIANWTFMAHLLQPLAIDLEPAARPYLPAHWRG